MPSRISEAILWTAVALLRGISGAILWTDDEQSDIDFLVELAPDRSLFDLGNFLYEMRSLLGREVDVVTENGLQSRIRSRVLVPAFVLRVLAEAVEL